MKRSINPWTFALAAAWSCALARADFPARPTFALKGVRCPYYLTFGDFNRDGQPDLAVSSWARLPGKGERYDHAKDRVLLFFQKKGRFAAPADREIPARMPWTLLAGDFDRDGKTDLAVKETRRRLHLFLGAENLAVAHTDTNINDYNRYAAAGRLSRGGLADFLCGPVWRKWLGGDRFVDGYCYGPRKNDHRAAWIADLDGDGCNDMIFLGPDSIRLYYGPFTTRSVRAGDAARFVEIRTPAAPRDLRVADLNADGRLDLVAALEDRKARSRSVVIYLQRAPLGFDSRQPPAAELRGGGGLVVADLNRDGLSDLVVSDSARNRVYVFMQRRGRPLAAGAEDAYQTLRTRCYALAVGDLNGDGFPDLAVSDGRSAVRFFLNDGKDRPPRTAARRTRPTAAPAPGPPPAAAPAAPPRGEAPRAAAAESSVAELIAKLPPPRPGRNYEDPCRMPFYTGVILPTPQQVTYKDDFFPLDRAAVVVGRGVQPADAFVRVLRDRIERYGGKLRVAASPDVECSTLIRLGDTPGDAALLQGRRTPDREQGYLMAARRAGGRPVVVLKARDRLGLLWAVSSFDQLVCERGGRPFVRAADAVDYPYAPNRGFIAGHWPAAGRYCLAFKINKPVFQSALADYSIRNRRARGEAWRKPLTEATLRDLRKYAEWLSPFGIQWYAGQSPIHCKNKIRSGDDGDFRVVLSWARAAEAAGGHLCLKYDDARFPISADDQKRFGSARKADVYLLTRLLRELKPRYPHARILFCPPFYWGPTSAALYPEPRDAYLYALGKLPADIEIFWTGPRVKSRKVTRDMMRWIVERIRRKPVYWQNAFGSPHMFTYHYVTDPIPVFREWFYDGFLRDVDTYMLNCMMPAYAAAAAACSDYCWNPRAYDPARSIREAACKLVGPDTYPALAALNRALSYFDPFGLRRTPGAARKLPEMKRRLALANRAWAEVKRRNLRAVRAWTGMERHVTQVNRFYERLRRSPDLAAYRREEAASLARAKKEAGFDKRTDIFLSAFDFTGGCGPAQYAFKCEKRLATWVYGRRSANPRMEAAFRVEPFPPEGDYELVLCGQDDDADAKCRIRISVNGTTVFEGANPFPRFGWSRRAFRLPAACLKRRSVVRIENLEDGVAGGPPFFMLNYAIVRKAR